MERAEKGARAESPSPLGQQDKRTEAKTSMAGIILILILILMGLEDFQAVLDSFDHALFRRLRVPRPCLRPCPA